ncbi:MAG TPA: hypothetical protein VLW26_12635 [Steroidobacteraceae bacterium]|nr:hypothetical protein [Steroidobacteraceae bacterium]
MATSAADLASVTTSGDRARSRRSREHWFYSALAILIAIAVFVGFAPSYYLKAHYAVPPPLTSVLHVHGAVFTLWIVLLVTQTSLVAADRTDLHRRLGVFGGIVAVVMTFFAAYVPISRFQEGLLGTSPGAPPAAILLAIALGSFVVFPVLVGSALYYRRRPDFHKRLMIIATCEVVTAAFGRWPVVGGNPLTFFAAADVFVLALVVHDLVTLRKVHSATLWGGLFFILSEPVRVGLSMTPAWAAFAAWLKS